MSEKNVENIITSIEKLSVLELSELVTALEDKFGVVAAAPVAMGAVAANGDTGEEAEEVKTQYNVVITAAGDKKINVIKAVREINGTLGLKAAKDLVDNPPATIAENSPTEEAEAAKAKLEEAGATVELQ